MLASIVHLTGVTSSKHQRMDIRLRIWINCEPQLVSEIVKKILGDEVVFRPRKVDRLEWHSIQLNWSDHQTLMPLG